MTKKTTERLEKFLGRSNLPQVQLYSSVFLGRVSFRASVVGSTNTGVAETLEKAVKHLLDLENAS